MTYEGKYASKAKLDLTKRGGDDMNDKICARKIAEIIVARLITDNDLLIDRVDDFDEAEEASSIFKWARSYREAMVKVRKVSKEAYNFVVQYVLEITDTVLAGDEEIIEFAAETANLEESGDWSLKNIAAHIKY